MIVTSALASSITIPVEEQPQSSVLPMLSPGYGYANFACTIFLKNRKVTEGKEQSAAIIGANLSKIHLVSYNSYAYNDIQ